MPLNKILILISLAIFISGSTSALIFNKNLKSSSQTFHSKPFSALILNYLTKMPNFSRDRAEKNFLLGLFVEIMPDNTYVDHDEVFECINPEENEELVLIVESLIISMNNYAESSKSYVKFNATITKKLPILSDSLVEQIKFNCPDNEELIYKTKEIFQCFESADALLKNQWEDPVIHGKIEVFFNTFRQEFKNENYKHALVEAWLAGYLIKD